jgi:hypothetical protein
VRLVAIVIGNASSYDHGAIVDAALAELKPSLS